MTQHGHAVANTMVKEEQTTKQQSEIRSARDSHHHGQPVVFTTARGGGGTAVHLLLLPICVFVSCPFVFLRGFSVCPANLPLKRMYLAAKRDPIPLFHHFLII